MYSLVQCSIYYAIYLFFDIFFNNPLPNPPPSHTHTHNSFMFQNGTAIKSLRTSSSELQGTVTSTTHQEL